MNTSAVIMFVVLILMACTYAGLGIYALCLKRPINFWAGTVVSPEEITDVKKYNRANGLMWLIYGLLFIPNAVMGFFNIFACTVVLMVLVFIGMPVLIFTYTRIYKKYKK